MSPTTLSKATLPTIEFTIKPPFCWGPNFVRLDTESVWKRLTPTSKASILSQDTVRLALQHFNTVMSQPIFDIHSLIEMKVGKDGKKPVVVTKNPLFLRIFRFYQDMSSPTEKGSYHGMSRQSRQAKKNTPIQREKPSSYQMWKDQPTESLTTHRKLARTMAETHGVDEGWMMYGISVALRMIECLLCDGHVIVIPEHGRFFARNISSDYPAAMRDVRIVFQAREDYGFKYKNPKIS